MAATGKTPILLYGSTTASNVPVAGNLTNSSDGCEIAINVADKNLFFKDSTNVVNTVPIRQSSTSSDGWLSLTDWNTFNGKAPSFTYTTGYIPFGQGTTTPTQSSGLQYNGSTFTTTGISTSNNLSFTGTGNLISGDLSNATVTNRVAFQTSTSNSDSYISVIPNGTGTRSGLHFFGSSSRTNCAFGQAFINAAEITFRSTYVGTSSFLPMTFWTSNNKRLQIETGGDVTLSTGNLVIGTSGKGIDFSATAGTGTSELLADYEEGTWTPAQGAGLTVVGAFSSSGTYTKIGRIVTVNGVLTGATSVASSSGGVITNNLPFNSAANYGGTYFNAALSAGGVVDAAGANVYAVGAIAATTSIYFTATYFV